MLSIWQYSLRRCTDTNKERFFFLKKKGMDKKVEKIGVSRKTHTLILQPSILLQCRVSALLGSGSRRLLLRFDLNDVRYCSLRRCYGQRMRRPLISLTVLIKLRSGLAEDVALSASKANGRSLLYLLESASHGWVDLKDVCSLCCGGGGVVEVFLNFLSWQLTVFWGPLCLSE